MNDERPRPAVVERPSEPRPWTPPVDEEFERYGEAYFISVTPRFMPRWLVHADPPGRMSAASGEMYSLSHWIRPAAVACAGIATWCLRKSWTVGVERRDLAGAADWKFVVREEYRSYTDACFRRGEIVEHWRDVLLTGWRAGDYTPLPFIDEQGPRPAFRTCPDPATRSSDADEDHPCA